MRVAVESGGIREPSDEAVNFAREDRHRLASAYGKLKVPKTQSLIPQAFL